MNETTRQEISRRWHGGASIRQIARDLSLARRTVSQALAAVQAAAGGALRPPLRFDPVYWIPMSQPSRNCSVAIPT